MSFLLGVLIIIFLPVILIPDNKQKRFETTLGDASKSKWIFKSLSSDEPCDVAFFGASFVLQAVNPFIIEKRLTPGISTLNLAMPYVGRDLEYVIIKETLEKQSPKVIVLQLRPTEGRTPHPMFVELASKPDFFTQPLLPTLAPIKDIGAFLQRQIRVITPNDLLPQAEPSVVENYAQNKGFKKIGSAMAPALLEQSVGHSARPLLPSSLEWLEYYRAWYYLEKIHKLCEEHHAQIVFILLPDFRDHRTPSNEAAYQRMGKVFHLPDEVIDNPAYRPDYSHFNSLGAEKISELLGDYLKPLL